MSSNPTKGQQSPSPANTATPQSVNPPEVFDPIANDDMFEVVMLRLKGLNPNSEEAKAIKSQLAEFGAWTKDADAIHRLKN